MYNLEIQNLNSGNDSSDGIGHEPLQTTAMDLCFVDIRPIPAQAMSTALQSMVSRTSNLYGFA